MKRSALKRRPKKRPQEGPLSPQEWFGLVFTLERDIYAPEPLDRVVGVHAHHIIPKALLRRRKLYDYVWDERNALVVSVFAHAAHHAKHTPIPRSALPASVWTFAQEIDDAGPERWAVAYLEKHYPEHATNGGLG